MLIVVYELSVFFEVLDVNGGESRNHKFQFFRIEDADKLWWDELMETFQKGFDLLLNCRRHLCVTEHLNVLQLILLGYGDATTVGFKILDLQLSKFIIVVGEGEFKDIGDVVLDQPYHILVEFVVFLLHIAVGDWQAKYMLVEGRGEERLHNEPIMHGLAYDPTHEFKERKMLWVDVRFW